MGIELSDVFVTLTPRGRWRRAGTQDELVRRMRAVLETLPGMRASFSQPIEMRVNEMVAGIRADLGIKIFGDDLDELRAAARRVDAIVRTIPGSADVSVEQVTGLPVLRVELDQAAASRFGIPAETVLATVAALAGVEVAELREGQRRFPVAVRIEPARAMDSDAIGALLVAAPDGTQVPLSQLARIRTESGPSTIQREWARRRITVQANVRGRDIASFVAEARRRIVAEARLAPGYSVTYGGQFEHLERARHRLLFVVPLCALVPGSEVALGPDARTPAPWRCIEPATRQNKTAKSASPTTATGANPSATARPTRRLPSARWSFFWAGLPILCTKVITPTA